MTTLSDREEIIKTIELFFQTGKTKDLAILKEIQLDDSLFSSFSDVPPYDLKDYKTSIALEEPSSCLTSNRSISATCLL